MKKRSFRRSRLFILLASAVLGVILGSTVAFGHILNTDTDIGLGGTGYWWGSGMTWTDWIEGWIKVKNRGEEYCSWLPETDWTKENLLYNNWIVGIMGNDTYSTGCVCTATLLSTSWHSAASHPSTDMTEDFMYHPNASC